MKRYLFLLIISIMALFGCTPEENPSQDQSGFDVELEIPAEIIIEENAKTIGFDIVDGKAPKLNDIILLDGPAGQKFCKIASVSGGTATVELYAGVKEGKHKEKHQHLGNEAENSAHTCNNTVKNKAAEPIGTVGR